MILTCPACRTRYQAEGSRFAPSGRDVRCAKCSHVWFQAPPEVETEPEPEPQIAAPDNARTAAGEGVHGPVRSPMSADAPAFGAAGEQSRRLAVIAGWAGLVGFTVTIAWSTIEFRQTVAGLWPQSASLYAVIGMPVNLVGLALEDVATSREMENGRNTLSVSGTIVNITGRELPVPQVYVTLSDAADRELYRWSFSAGIATLPPGAASPFVTRLSDPPPEARTIDVAFAPQTGP